MLTSRCEVSRSPPHLSTGTGTRVDDFAAPCGLLIDATRRAPEEAASATPSPMSRLPRVRLLFATAPMG